LKICAISSGFASWPGGPEVALEYLGKYWVESGHDVYVLCGKGEKRGSAGVKVFQFPFVSRKYFDNMPIVSRLSFLLPTFEMESFTLVPSLLSSVSRIKPDIVLTITLPETIVPLLLGCPTIMISQGGLWYRMKLYEKADMIIVNEPISLEKLRKLGLNVKFIINGTETKSSQPELLEKMRAKYNIPKDGKTILTVARLDTQKRIHLLIEAFKLIKETATLVIVGEGPEQLRLQKMVDSIQNKVLFLGKIPHDDVLMLYEICDVFSLPSLMEACSLAIIEAVSLGKPVVTNPEPIKMLLLDDYGHFVNVESPQEYASALLAAVSDGMSARTPKFREFVDRYSWKRIAQDYLDVFEMVLDKRSMDHALIRS